MQVKGISKLVGDLLKLQELAESVQEALIEKREEVEDSENMADARREEWEEYLDQCDELVESILDIDAEIIEG